MSAKTPNVDTLALHAASRKAPTKAQAVVPPITLATTFERGVDGSYPDGYSYTRTGNPNRSDLEQALAKLEGGSDALCFSSGSAATMALLMALAPGDHVIAPKGAYHGTKCILTKIMNRWGLDVSLVDGHDMVAITQAIKPTTRLLWVETPSNPLLDITDIAAVVERARRARALVCCDNTFASPVLQNPLTLGADFVMHSTTKSIGGHSDVLGGALIARQDSEIWQRAKQVQKEAGAVPSPFDSWLTLRGLKTMPLRVRQSSSNALAIARYLHTHPKITHCYYPGLEAHPGHALAQCQMPHGFGGVLAFRLGSRQRAMDLVAKLELVTRATSLGGVESTIEHRASMEGPDTKTPDDLVRMSVGVESAADLIEDLRAALLQLS